MIRIALAALLALPAFGAVAETIYRCGNTYQQTPCSGATLIDAGDARSKSQWAEANAVATEDRRLGQEMERQRMVSEARAATAPAAFTAPPVVRPQAATSATKHPKVKQRRYVAMASALPNEFIAVAPHSKPR